MFGVVLGCVGFVILVGVMGLLIDTLVYAPVIYAVWNWILPMAITGLKVLTFAQAWWIGLALAIVMILIWPGNRKK